jgi:hypothetical protein
MRGYSADVCGLLGPYVKVSAKYERPVMCNRIINHPGRHAERDARTFKVIHEWDDTPPDVVEPNKRLIDRLTKRK